VQPTITTEDFTVDLSAARVTADGKDVKLTPTEWHLLEVLARNAGRVVDHGRLLTEVWGPAYREQTNYLRVCTSPRCAASSSPTRPTPATCSPRPAAGTASSRESRAGRGPPELAVTCPKREKAPVRRLTGAFSSWGE
jgi:hypothetical protein